MGDIAVVVGVSASNGLGVAIARRFGKGGPYGVFMSLFSTVQGDVAGVLF